MANAKKQWKKVTLKKFLRVSVSESTQTLKLEIVVEACYG